MAVAEHSFVQTLNEMNSPAFRFSTVTFFFPHYARQVLDQKPQPGQNSLSVNYSSN